MARKEFCAGKQFSYERFPESSGSRFRMVTKGCKFLETSPSGPGSCPQTAIHVRRRHSEIKQLLGMLRVIGAAAVFREGQSRGRFAAALCADAAPVPKASSFPAKACFRAAESDSLCLPTQPLSRANRFCASVRSQLHCVLCWWQAAAARSVRPASRAAPQAARLS